MTTYLRSNCGLVCLNIELQMRKRRPLLFAAGCCQKAVATLKLKFRKFYDEDDSEMVERLKKECEMVILNSR